MRKFTFAGIFFSAFVLLKAQTIINPGLHSKNSFAIIVDSKTYNGAKDEVLAYKNSIEKDGLGSYVIYSDWKKPEEIRNLLKKLYDNDKQPLEGAVFVGDIPIPMIRGAQYLTSAFKMSETIKWQNSSVASDRYYDDFDLQFDFLKQDEDAARKNYFYYQIKPESPQYIEMDIYSARIKPPISKGVDPVDQIKKYLKKIIKIKDEVNPLDQMIVSTGHSYNSDSSISWGEELLALKSSFPNLFHQGNSIKFLNYRTTEFLKNPLLLELRKDKLDFAFMTSHGYDDAQLLSGYPDVSAPQPSMENVGRYIRSKMRNAKESGRDLDKVKADFQKNLGLNDKWFSNAFDRESIVKDSIYNENLDIHAGDIKNINARVVYLNSCLTGSFHLEDYLAGHYPFSDGKNVVAIANSVGVLQDLWSTQLLGILQNGVRVGHLLKKTAFLETHIMGDPTFHFQGDNQDYLNELFGSKTTKRKDWENVLKINDADLQAYALTELYYKIPEKDFSKLLYSYYTNSPYESTRTEAYFLLRKYQNETFRKVLNLAFFDNYEYLQRKSIYDATEMGDNSLINPIVNVYINNREAERVISKISWMLQFLNYDEVKKELNAQLANNSDLNNAQELLADSMFKIEREKKSTEENKSILASKDSKEKEVLNVLKTLRNYRNHQIIPSVLDVVIDENRSENIRVTALETLSWFGMSYYKDEILKVTEEVAKKTNNNAIKEQAVKTINVINDTGKRPF